MCKGCARGVQGVCKGGRDCKAKLEVALASLCVEKWVPR